MLCYRGLGQTAEAEREEQLFRRFKADESAAGADRSSPGSPAPRTTMKGSRFTITILSWRYARVGDLPTAAGR